MRFLLALCFLVGCFLCPSAHAQQTCTMRRFATGTGPVLVALPAQTVARTSFRVCLFHVVIQWGPTAGNFFFFASTTPDCLTPVAHLTATYYGVPNSVQDARDAPPPGAFLQLLNTLSVCLSVSATPTAANTEVFYAP